MNEEQLFDYLKFNKDDTSNLFKGFLNDKLAEYIIGISKINKNKIDMKDTVVLVRNISNLEFTVIGLYPLKEGQVCSGGVSLLEINDNLELIKYPNIYIAGELLDIDGVSGGYNLQFAWSSAGVIANHIKNKTKRNK